jgi:uncharacterized membrane protein (DUF4010 family)
VLTSPEVVSLVVALGVGLLIGVDRERRKGEGPTRAAAGVRTFVVVSLCGAITALFESPVLIAVGAVLVGLLAIVSYQRTQERDPGLTTEFALIVTYLVGALSYRSAQLAAGLGTLIALLLASRHLLHEFVRSRLNDREVFDGLLLAGAALVILPLMPNRAVDPLAVVNPYVIWKLTVIVLLINAFGYVAQRALGPGRGLPVAGFFGGFVSSSATIAALGARARERPALLRACQAGAALSNVATVVQLVLVLGVVNPALLRRLWLPLLLMAIVAVAAGVIGVWRARAPDAEVMTGRAFQPRQALAFSVTVTTLLMLAAALEHGMGVPGAVLGIALGGFADTHSAAASAATLAVKGSLTAATATLATLVALSTNTLTKLIVAAITGGRAYVGSLAPSLALMIVGAWFGLVLAFWVGKT